MSETHDRATRILDDAMRLMSEKNTKYQDAWKEAGWRGCLARVMSKTARLRNMLWRNNVSLLNGDKEHPRETALDMINHLVFFIINLDDGREWGHEQNLPEYADMPVSDAYPYAYPQGQHAPWQVQQGHPEQPSAMGQHTQIQESPFTDEQAPETPSPQPRDRSTRRKIKDGPQA